MNIYQIKICEKCKKEFLVSSQFENAPDSLKKYCSNCL